MVDENMANAARVHAIESGKTYTGRTLIAFGGGGPVHGYRVAEKVGIDRVLVPAGAGVGSAIGFLRAPVGYEVVRNLRAAKAGGALPEKIYQLTTELAAQERAVTEAKQAQNEAALRLAVSQAKATHDVAAIRAAETSLNQ